jgi:hypothetical protein
MLLGNNLVSWALKHQPVFSRSSAEADYHAMPTTWLRPPGSVSCVRRSKAPSYTVLFSVWCLPSQSPVGVDRWIRLPWWCTEQPGGTTDNSVRPDIADYF